MISGRYRSRIQDFQDFIKRIVGIVRRQTVLTCSDLLENIGNMFGMIWVFCFYFWYPGVSEKKQVVSGLKATFENPEIMDMRSFGLSNRQSEKS